MYLSEIFIKWKLKRESCGCWDPSRENLIPGHSLVAVPGFQMKSELFSFSIQMPLIFNDFISQHESSAVAKISLQYVLTRNTISFYTHLLLLQLDCIHLVKGEAGPVLSYSRILFFSNGIIFSIYFDFT